MWPFANKSPASAPPAAHPPAPELVYGHYQVLREAGGGPWLLGHGAMGITYKAEDTSLRVPVALKVISPLIAEQPGAREFFLTEARGAASLRHRNAAAVHHLGVSRTGELFFAMEFIEGETVDALIRRQRRLDVPLALDIAQQTACALTAAHQRGIVHRDLKPANLMLHQESDGTLVVKVIDFGLCKLVRRGESATRLPGAPAPSEFIGTAHYASPEQIRGDGQLDGRSDFYSLGATLWTMLAGEPVFHGSLAQVRRRHLEELPPFDDLPATVSAPVRGLLASLLRKDPAQRPQTPLELIDCIEGAAYDDRGAEADPRKHWKTQTCVPLLGSLLAHNYHLEALADESQRAAANPVFRAEDVRAQRPVAVQLLDRDKPLDDLRLNVDRLAAAPHPNLVGSHALSSCRGQPFLVREWINGFSLEEVMRARAGVLAPAEVPRLLHAAVAAWEHIQSHDLGTLDLSLHAIQVQFGGEPLSARQKRALPVQWMDVWPDFSLKFNVEIAREDAPPAGAGAGREIVRRLGNLAAELLGHGAMSIGVFDRVSADGGVRLPGQVPAEAARVIDLALAAEPAFTSASQFHSALSLALSRAGNPVL